MNTATISELSIDDIVVSSPESRARLDMIKSGQYPFSRTQSTIILLVGPFGSGKTCLAKLLPKVVEGSLNNHQTPVKYHYVECRQDNQGAQDYSKLKNISYFSAISPQQLNYFILDEFDNLPVSCQSDLYQTVQSGRSVWILTSNYLHKISSLIQSIALTVFMDSPSLSTLEQHVYKISAHLNTHVSAQEARTIANLCQGSWRQVYERFCEVIATRQNHSDFTGDKFNYDTLIDPKSVHKVYRCFEDFEPTTVDEIIISDLASRCVLKRLVLGESQRVVDRCIGVLIHGAANTQARLLASFIPETMERLAYRGELSHLAFHEFTCRPGRDGLNMMQTIDTVAHQVTLGHVSGLKYIVLYDIDLLADGAQRSLKSLMNRADCVFILVTTDIHQVDRGVLDRCTNRVFLSAPHGESLYRSLDRMAAVKGVTLSAARREALSEQRWQGLSALYASV